MIKEVAALRGSVYIASGVLVLELEFELESLCPT